VIPISSASANTGITALNKAIPAWAASQNTTASPIYIADCSTGFPTSDLRDGIHPNVAGDAIIASRVTPVLLKVIKDSLATGTTTAKSFEA
jgi:lysophospholipase L1-like esterase